MGFSMRFIAAFLLACGAQAETCVKGEVCDSEMEPESSSLLQFPQGMQTADTNDMALLSRQTGCQGSDSRCAGRSATECEQLVREGAECGYVYPEGTTAVTARNCEEAVRDIVLDGHTKACTGNDSRCPGADEGRCNQLHQEGADCLWVEDHDFFRDEHVCYNHEGVVLTCKDLVQNCMENAQRHVKVTSVGLLQEESLVSVATNETSGASCTASAINFGIDGLTVGLNAVVPVVAYRAAREVMRDSSRIVLLHGTGEFTHAASVIMTTTTTITRWRQATQVWNVMYAVLKSIGVRSFVKSIKKFFRWWTWVLSGIIILATIGAWYGSAGAMAIAEIAALLFSVNNFVESSKAIVKDCIGSDDGSPRRRSTRRRRR